MLGCWAQVIFRAPPAQVPRSRPETLGEEELRNTHIGFGQGGQSLGWLVSGWCWDPLALVAAAETLPAPHLRWVVQGSAGAGTCSWSALPGPLVSSNSRLQGTRAPGLVNEGLTLLKADLTTWSAHVEPQRWNRATTVRSCLDASRLCLSLLPCLPIDFAMWQILGRSACFLKSLSGKVQHLSTGISRKNLPQAFGSQLLAHPEASTALGVTRWACIPTPCGWVPAAQAPVPGAAGRQSLSLTT